MEKQQEETITSLLEKLDENSKEFQLLFRIDGFLKELEHSFEINEEQKTILDGEMTNLILKKEPIEHITEIIQTHLNFSMEGKKVEKILIRVKDFLSQDISTLPEKLIPKKEDLKIIQEQFNAPIVMVPTKREQSISKPDTVAGKKVDPYREPIG